MNTSLQTFQFHTHQLTVIVDEHSEPWFIAKEVCEILDYSDTSMTVKRLDDDEKLVQTLFVSGQNREVLLINESGLYSLILTSRKPEAKAFKKWVTSEVLPAIRKTGSYIAPDKIAALEELAKTQKMLIDSQTNEIAYTKERTGKLFEAHKQLTQHCEHLRFSHDVQAKAAKENLARCERALKPIASQERAEVVAKYESGLGVHLLARYFYRSPAIIRRTLREAGVLV